MRWALQTTLINQDHAKEILDALKSIDKPFVFADPFPFTEQLVEEIEGVDYIPYGSTTLMKIAAKRGWEGLAFDPLTFDHREWVEERLDMLNQGARHIPIREANVFLRSLSPQTLMFIRPVGDLKLFSGMVAAAVEALSHFSALNLDEVVVIADVHSLRAEWRCFIVDGNVVSVSMYRCENRQLLRREDNPAVLSQMRVLAEGWLPHVNCVMDVALSSGSFKVIEFNCINASGFYACDVALVLRAMSRYYGC